MTKSTSQIRYPHALSRRKRHSVWFALTLWVLAASSQVSAFATHRPLASHRTLAPTSSSALHFSATEIAFLRANGQQQVSEEEEDFYVHGIVPETKSIPASMAHFALFVAQRLIENRQMNVDRKTGKEPPKQGFRANWKALNEQRRNLAKLAGYNAPIIIPSFTFLLLGALTTSVIPQFYSECIQCVATLDPSRAKCMRALAGLAITSTLGALFTGMRGSLFWVAGEWTIE